MPRWERELYNGYKRMTLAHFLSFGSGRLANEKS